METGTSQYLFSFSVKYITENLQNKVSSELPKYHI